MSSSNATGIRMIDLSLIDMAIAKPLIGWAASAILLLTLISQVRTQWITRSTQGVSRRLFIGQSAASLGFLSYSALVGDTVFIFTNACILLTALIGQLVYRRNRKLAARKEPSASED
jgi:MtN3 and saliva related transmembrane protein